MEDAAEEAALEAEILAKKKAELEESNENLDLLRTMYAVCEKESNENLDLLRTMYAVYEKESNENLDLLRTMYAVCEKESNENMLRTLYAVCEVLLSSHSEEQ
jgi:mannitol/fructose-specific phosphotransferase system IIA component